MNNIEYLLLATANPSTQVLFFQELEFSQTVERRHIVEEDPQELVLQKRDGFAKFHYFSSAKVSSLYQAFSEHSRNQHKLFKLPSEITNKYGIQWYEALERDSMVLDLRTA